MKWNLLFPDGLKKALTFSYDDGQIYDRMLVDIFNRYGMKGTFHLNSKKLDTPGFVTSAEISKLYIGHEISCHGATHAYLPSLSLMQLIKEIYEDRRNLEHMAAYPVCGLSYASGGYNDDVIQAAKLLGIEYSRTVVSTKTFDPPADPFVWNPTCHHSDDIDNFADLFLKQNKSTKLLLFYIWGHSYEFHSQNNWERMERFCEKLAFKSDIWYTTNINYIRYLSAAKCIVTDVESTMLYNPSGLTVWIEVGDTEKQIAPGQMIKL